MHMEDGNAVHRDCQRPHQGEFARFVERRRFQGDAKGARAGEIMGHGHLLLPGFDAGHGRVTGQTIALDVQPLVIPGEPDFMCERRKSLCDSGGRAFRRFQGVGRRILDGVVDLVGEGHTG